MRKLNQRGIAHHLLLIVLAVVVVGAAGFAGWRVFESRKSAKAENCATQVTLRSGATGPGTCVYKMKVLLKFGVSDENAAKVNSTNTYDPATVAVVKEFQKVKGLTVDGVVGTKQTWPALCGLGLTSTDYKKAKLDAGCGNAEQVATRWSPISYVKPSTVMGDLTGMVEYSACKISMIGSNRVRVRAKNNTNKTIYSIGWQSSGSKDVVNNLPAGASKEWSYFDFTTGYIYAGDVQVYSYSISKFHELAKVDLATLPYCP